MATQVSMFNTLSISQRKLFLEYARSRVRACQSSLGDFQSLLRYRDRAYQRQLDTTAEHIKAVRSNMAGDARKIQNMTVPIVMPQIESAVAYQAGVFLTSYPIFGMVAGPQTQDAAMKFETAIGDQSIRYGWARELIKTFRDGFKYNFGAAVVHWKKTPLRAIVTDTSISNAGRAKVNETSYGGNCITRIDPYNCFMDMSVAPADLHTEGEFFGWNTTMSRVMLKTMLTRLDSAKTTNAKEAYESQFAGSSTAGNNPFSHYYPQINQYLDLGRSGSGDQMDWGAWMGIKVNDRNNKINYKEHYVVSHFYCRAVPSDFNAYGNQVKIYHAIIVNWQHVVFVEELNPGYDYLPCMVMQPYEDGLGYQTQSMLDNALPFQDMSSALWNISLESKRRLIFDRLVYNPSMINAKDIDPVSSVARIPLRNAHIGKAETAMQRAVYQIPYREDNSASNIQMSDMISGMADQAAGQNKVDRGEFQKGNKTKTEFDTTMTNSNSRQQLVALTIEQQFMTPVKEIIKSNTLQFQPTGKLLNRDSREVVDIDPVALREAILEFKMTDGMLPADKMLNGEVLTVFMQTAQAIPGVSAEYDIMGMFLYWAKLRGAYWLEDFKRSPEQQQQFNSNVQASAAAQSTGEAAGDATLQQQPGV